MWKNIWIQCVPGVSLKGKQLKKDGKGRKPNETEEVTTEEKNV